MKYTVNLEYYSPRDKEWLRVSMHNLEAGCIREADTLARNQYCWTQVSIKGIWETNGEEDYNKRENAVFLHGEDWTKLGFLLSMAEHHCEGERDTWERIGKELGPDGEPEFPNAAGNFEFWTNMIDACARIKEAASHAI